jgi:phage gpG-like protein
MSVEWHGDAAMDHVRGRAVQFLYLAAFTVERKAKDLLSVAGSGRVKGRKSGPVTHSRPGESPRKQTGILHDSVTSEVDPSSLSARVGSNLKYAAWLELGTGRIAPRPWLRRALAEMQSRVNELLAKVG